MNNLKRFLAPPVFVDDVEKTRIASMLNVILLVNMGAWGVALVTLHFDARTQVGLVAPALVFVIGVVAWVLFRAGYVYGVARFFVSFLWVLATTMIVISGGIGGPETSGYLLAIAIAGILSGVWIMLAFAGLSIVGLVGIFVLEMLGRLPPLLFKPTPFGGLVIAVANSLALSAVFYLVLSDVRQSLIEARRSRQALADRDRELEAARASLEDHVAARTQVAEMVRLDAENANAALQEQMWLVAGLAQLGDVMRGVEDISVLAKAVLAHLCRYLEAQVGALYVSDDDALILAETYACRVDASHLQRFAWGEGLVGQVAAEGLPHKLKGSDHSFTVNSSFGEIVLAQVILYPLLYVGTVVGVLELGRITPFTEAHEQFLEQALERLALVIHTARSRTQINALLQETQQQAEELRAQEEELRAANEELEAQTESLRDRR